MPFDYLDTVLPEGVSGSSLVCVYQFDGPTDGYDDRSGNGHDLSAYGAPLWSRSEQGEGMLQGVPDSWAQTDAKTGVFNTLGALSIEWVGQKGRYMNASEYLFGIGIGSSEAESLNLIVALMHRASDSSWLGFRVVHEQGAGGDIYTDFQWGEPFGGPHHGVLTRASDGKTYKLYSDGELLETAVASTAPTGGDGAIRIYIHGAGVTTVEDSSHGTSSWRYCKGVEFTLAQVQESYARIHS